MARKATKSNKTNKPKKSKRSQKDLQRQQRTKHQETTRDTPTNHHQPPENQATMTAKASHKTKTKPQKHHHTTTLPGTSQSTVELRHVEVEEGEEGNEVQVQPPNPSVEEKHEPQEAAGM